MIRGSLSHLDLTVRDLSPSVRFYDQILRRLGYRSAYTPGYYAVFFADPDGLKLELVHEPKLRGRTG